MSFEVPCECGRRLAVTAGDAGTEVRCGCGRAVVVPDLRTLRTLDQSTEPSPSSPKQEQQPQPPIPKFVWLFVVCCGFIPVLTLGGAIPGGLAAAGAVSCIGVARNEAWSVATRVTLCTAITVACWALFLVIYGELLALRFKQAPR